MNRYLQSGLLLAGVLLFVAPLCAQLQLGGISLSATGNVAASYDATYGNLTNSDHSVGVGGTGSITGYYFNPNFLSFSATPYYDSSRDSSAYRSLSNASGFDTQATIFGGSSFPGTVSYSKAYNSQATFNLPGLANFTTHGNSDSLGIGWGEHVQGLPSLTASFQKTGSQNTIYGVSQGATSSSHSFNLNSSYQWLGFGLGASYYMGGSGSEFPEVLSGTTETATSHSTDHGYSFDASHRIPWNGSAFGNFTSSTMSSSFRSLNADFTVDNLATGATLHPTSKLDLSANMSYSSNLSGSIEQQVISSGGVVVSPLSQSSSVSRAFDYVGSAGYLPMAHMQVQGQAERRVQDFVGKTFGANTYTGETNYSRPVWNGHMSAGLSVEDSTVDNSPLNTLGFTVSTGYSRKIGRWDINGGFNYAQGVQTLLVTYSNSNYGYSGSVRRKWQNGIMWTGSYGASRTGLTGLSGTTSKSDSYSMGLSLGRWANLGGSYSKSSGDAIATGMGLVTTPLPLPILPASSIVMFGGKSYSYSIGSSPINRLTLSASYAKSQANTGGVGGATGSTNISESLNTMVRYQFRKMYLTGGFSRLTQGFSASGLPPQTVSAYYISISRWFNFF